MERLATIDADLAAFIFSAHTLDCGEPRLRLAKVPNHLSRVTPAHLRVTPEHLRVTPPSLDVTLQRLRVTLSELRLRPEPRRVTRHVSM